MKTTTINILLAMIVAAGTIGLIAWTDADYGKGGTFIKVLYLIGGVFCIIKVIPWNKKD